MTSMVVTGASSGIGRALALEAARRGWSVAVGARRADALASLVEECERLGGAAVAATTDVSDVDSVESLAAAAVGTFGPFDAWVNAAGVYMVGTFEQTPAASFARLLEIDLLGVANGSRAALRVFRRTGRGVLVNVSSLTGGLAVPYVSAYAAAKWGVSGFSLSLREELRDAPGIHVCVVRPASIDTPIFRRTANYTGRPVQALSPTYDVELAAHTIADLVTHPRREVIVGRSGKVLSALHRFAPRLVDRSFARRVPGNHFGSGSAPRSDGNLFESSAGWETTSGGWPTT